MKNTMQKASVQSQNYSVHRTLYSERFSRSFYYNSFILLFHKAVLLFAKNMYYCSGMTVANLWLGDVLCFQCCMRACVCVCVCVYNHVQLTLIFVCLSRSNHVYQIIVNKWAGPFSA